MKQDKQDSFCNEVAVWTAKDRQNKLGAEVS